MNDLRFRSITLKNFDVGLTWYFIWTSWIFAERCKVSVCLKLTENCRDRISDFWKTINEK